MDSVTPGRFAVASSPLAAPYGIFRRTALGHAGAAAAAIGLSSRVGHAAAQETTPGDMAGHPIVGAWLAIVPSPPAPASFAADGIVTIAYAPNYVDPVLGLTYQGPMLGTWEPISERGIHFTAIQTLTDAEGTLVGTFTLESHPLVDADGQGFTDVTPDARIIVRDANHAFLVDEIITGGVTAVRITPGSLIFPEGTPVAGTPTG